ncbi:MAG: hypothetical protein O3A15_06490 [Proteobacteria bacterium]|jgi:hypothetical protein|nr:hypothetical protein [Pseudomonadota bacterium]
MNKLLIYITAIAAVILTFYLTVYSDVGCKYDSLVLFDGQFVACAR